MILLIQIVTIKYLMIINISFAAYYDSYIENGVRRVNKNEMSPFCQL